MSLERTRQKSQSHVDFDVGSWCSCSRDVYPASTLHAGYDDGEAGLSWYSNLNGQRFVLLQEQVEVPKSVQYTFGAADIQD